MDLLHPKLRNLYNPFICRDPLVRHALRLTCKTLHGWIETDADFIMKLAILAGHMPDRTLTHGHAAYVLLVAIKETARRGWCHPVPLIWRSIDGKSIQDVEITNVDVLIGEVTDAAIEHMLRILFECDKSCAVIESILRPQYFRWFFKWRCSYDAGPKEMYLTRTYQE